MKDKLSAHLEKAKECLALDEKQEAVIHFSKALSIAELIDDPIEIAEVKTYLVKVLNLIQDFKLAIKYGEGVRSDYLNDIASRRRYYANMASCFGEIGYWEDAFKHYESLSNLDDTKSKNRAYIGMGLLCWRMEEKNEETYQKALRYFEEAEKYIQSNMEKFYITSNRGELHSLFGNYEMAVADIELAFRYAGSDDNKAGAYNIKGIALLKSGEYDKALESLNAAVELSKRTKNNLRIGYSRKWMGCTYKQKHMYERAIEEFEKALLILKEKDICQEVAECCWELHALYRERDKQLSDKYRIEAEGYLKAFQIL